MATRKPNDPKRLLGEDDLTRVYRAGGSEAPSPNLDAQILAAARAAVHPAPRRRWAVPLSTAALVVLSFSVVLLMTKEGALDRDGTLSPVSEYSLPPAEAPPGESKLADARMEERTVEQAKAKRAAPEPAKPMPASPAVQSAERKLAESAPAEAKAEAPVAAAPPALGRAIEVDRLRKASEETARTRASTTGALAMKATAAGAEVTGVAASGLPGAYTFNVTIKSPDTGCQQFADWWEVVSEDGRLLYRRVLLHSHVDEQPFTRSGGPVPIRPETIVWVRAHMNSTGYGSVAFKGSVKGGFARAEVPVNFATGLAKQPPLPEGCDS